MSKRIILPMIILATLVAGSTLSASPGKAKFQPKVTLWAVGEMLMPQDSDYKELYGDLIFTPKAKLTVHFTPRLHLFAAYSFSNRQGSVQFMELSFDMECKQNLIRFGAGWTSPLSEKMDWYLEAGGMFAQQEESGMEKNIKESMLGFCAETGLTYKLAKSVFAQVHAGYSQAQKDLELTTIKAGGIGFGFGIGYRF